MNNWHQVWSNKTAKADETAELLPQLIKLNGFDTGFGSITPKQWKLMTKRLSEISNCVATAMFLKLDVVLERFSTQSNCTQDARYRALIIPNHLLKLQNTT